MVQHGESMANMKDPVSSVQLMDCNWRTPADGNGGSVEAAFLEHVIVIVHESGKVDVHCPVKGRHHDCTLEKDIPANMPKPGEEA